MKRAKRTRRPFLRSHLEVYDGGASYTVFMPRTIGKSFLPRLMKQRLAQIERASEPPMQVWVDEFAKITREQWDRLKKF